MFLLCEETRKRALDSLFSDQPLDIPDFTAGEVVSISAARIEALATSIGSRLFSVKDSTGWVFRAGIGTGYLAPVAGTYFIRSGIALTAGLLGNGKRYKIVTFNAGDNFTNVGAGSNASNVVFTATGTTPTTWTHASELQEITANLDFDADESAIETALNATGWVNAAGGLTTTLDGNIFLHTFTSPGARTEMIGEGANLAPLSDVDFGTLIEGDANLQEVQSMFISQQPATWVDLTDPLPSADATVTELQAGSGGLNHKVRLTLDPVPFDGSLTLNIRGIESALISYGSSGSDLVTILEGISVASGLLVVGAKYKIVSFIAGDDFTNVGAGSNATDVVFTATGTTPTTWTNASELTPVGSGNVGVSRESDGSYLIVFQGDMADTDMGDITADPSGLQVVNGFSGDLHLDVPGIELLLAGETTQQVTFSVRGTPSGGSPVIIFSADATLRDTIFTPGSETPQPRAQYYTKDEVDDLLADPANFAALDLSGLPTADPGGGKPWLNGGVLQVGA